MLTEPKETMTKDLQSPGQCSSVTWMSNWVAQSFSIDEKVVGSIPGHSVYPGCGSNPWLRYIWEGNQLMSICLHLSPFPHPSSSLKPMKKNVLRWGRFKKKHVKKVWMAMLYHKKSINTDTEYIFLKPNQTKGEFWSWKLQQIKNDALQQRQNRTKWTEDIVSKFEDRSVRDYANRETQNARKIKSFKENWETGKYTPMYITECQKERARKEQRKYSKKLAENFSSVLKNTNLHI